MDKLKAFSALMMLMSNPAMIPSLGKGIAAEESFVSRFDGGNMMKVLIMGIVTLVVVSQLGVAIVPSSVTAISNTSASTATGGNGTAGNPYTGGYNSWSSSAQSTWSAIPAMEVLIFFLFFVLILVAAVKEM